MTETQREDLKLDSLDPEKEQEQLEQIKKQLEEAKQLMQAQERKFEGKFPLEF